MTIANYTLPILTLEKFTAQHALETYTRKKGLTASGLCKPDAPWGDQCTKFLADGTPVDSHFVRAVLQYLSGNAKAAPDYIQKWEARVRKICAEWRYPND